jgi:hypothetical protein
VSTDDQVEQSPDAQRRRCAEYAAQKNLGPVKFLSDEGQSGKDLERPAMQELVGLIEADQVTNLDDSYSMLGFNRGIQCALQLVTASPGDGGRTSAQHGREVGDSSGGGSWPRPGKAAASVGR